MDILHIPYYVCFISFIAITFIVIKNLQFSYGYTGSIKRAKKKIGLKVMFPEGNRDLHIICSKHTFLLVPIYIHIDETYVTTIYRGDRTHMPLDENAHKLKVALIESVYELAIPQSGDQEVYISTDRAPAGVRLTHGNLKILEDEAYAQFNTRKWCNLIALIFLQLFGILLLLRAFAVF